MTKICISVSIGLIEITTLFCHQTLSFSQQTQHICTMLDQRQTHFVIKEYDKTHDIFFLQHCHV